MQPVHASALDSCIEGVARGIESYEQLKAEKMLEYSFGVTFGEAEDMENWSPSQRQVYMIGAAKQSPFAVPRVRETFARDIVYYYLICICIIVVTVGLDMAQKDYPEEIAAISNRFTGHDGFFDYSMSFKTTLKLALLPIFVFAAIDTLISFEQVLSAGLMGDSIEYISLSAETSGIWLFESISYVVNMAFFAIRIQYINEFTANILKLIILYVIPWGWLVHVAEMFAIWFCSALFMRPLVLWYSSKAVQYIAEQDGVASKLAATASVMPTVSSFTLLTAIVLVLGPILYLVVKIVVYYFIGAGHKVMRYANEMRRNRA